MYDIDSATSHWNALWVVVQPPAIIFSSSIFHIHTWTSSLPHQSSTVLSFFCTKSNSTHRRTFVPILFSELKNTTPQKTKKGGCKLNYTDILREEKSNWKLKKKQTNKGAPVSNLWPSPRWLLNACTGACHACAGVGVLQVKTTINILLQFPSSSVFLDSSISHVTFLQSLPGNDAQYFLRSQ